MLKQGIATGFFLAALAGLTPGASVWAKPADLPGNNHIECTEGDDVSTPKKLSLELDINAKGITLKVQVGAAEPAPTPVIDPLIPALVEHWVQHAMDAITRPDRSWNVDYLLGKLPYLQPFHAPSVFQKESQKPALPAETTRRYPPVTPENQAKKLFDLANIYRASGLYEPARIIYQQVHRLSPTSQLGRLAIDRLQEMEERLRDASEEQGNRGGDPEASSRDIRNGSIPLGLVVVTY